MTSFIAAGGSGRSASVIPAVPAAWSVTTIAFILDTSLYQSSPPRCVRIRLACHANADPAGRPTAPRHGRSPSTHRWPLGPVAPLVVRLALSRGSSGDIGLTCVRVGARFRGIRGPGGTAQRRATYDMALIRRPNIPGRQSLKRSKLRPEVPAWPVYGFADFTVEILEQRDSISAHFVSRTAMIRARLLHASALFASIPTTSGPGRIPARSSPAGRVTWHIWT
jgi:hypothetical protein